MKLSKHAFTRFWDVHAWAGVCAGLLLHVIFFAGAFTVFREDLEVWQDPALAVSPTEVKSVDALMAPQLATLPRAPEIVGVWLPSPEHATLAFNAKLPGEAEWRAMVRLDPTTGAIVAPGARSRLSTILYYLHFLYHPNAPWGMYVAGFVTVALLLVLVTGVLIHIKDLARQLHQFRPKQKLRVVWSDLHKVLGVFGIPFQMMYAFTGIVIALAGLQIAAYAWPLYGGDEKAARQAMYGTPAIPEKPSGITRASLPFDDLLTRARTAVPELEPRLIRVHHLGDENATAQVWGDVPGVLFSAWAGGVVMRAHDGQVLHTSDPRVSATPASAVWRWVGGLHYIYFGGLGLRILYALLAFATCFTILTGNWIWLERRDAKRAHVGNRIFERLTVAAGGGLCLATAALFWTNRVFPVGSAGRKTAEALAFFGVWTVALVYCLIRRNAHRAWIATLGPAGTLMALLPLVSAVAADKHVFNLSAHGAWAIAGVDLGMAVLGLGLIFTARALHLRTRVEALALIAGIAPATSHTEDPTLPEIFAAGRSSR